MNASSEKLRRRRGWYEKLQRDDNFEAELERAKIRLLERSTNEVVLADVEMVEGSVTFAVGGKSVTDFLSNEVTVVLECEVWLTPLQAVEEDLEFLRNMREEQKRLGSFDLVRWSGVYASELFRRDRIRAGEAA